MHVTRKRTRTRKEGKAERKGEVASDEKGAVFVVVNWRFLNLYQYKLQINFTSKNLKVFKFN